MKVSSNTQVMVPPKKAITRRINHFLTRVFNLFAVVFFFVFFLFDDRLIAIFFLVRYTKLEDFFQNSIHLVKSHHFPYFYDSLKNHKTIGKGEKTNTFNAAI